MPEQASSRPRIDKLGIKPGMRVLLLGVDDAGFVDELRSRTGEILDRVADDCGAVFLAVSQRRDLQRIAPLVSRLRRDGALWVIRPRGSGEDISEADTRRAGLEAGLVDVKVVHFSETHSALKFVRRLRDR